MNIRRVLAFAMVLTLLSGAAKSDVTTCKDFELLDPTGKRHRLSDTKTRFKVIAFLGTECPLAKLYSQRLNDLSSEFEKRVTVFGLVSNSQDSNNDIAAFVRRHDLEFPVLKDLRHEVADQLEAQRTPEVFLLDAENRVRYQGRIDDQYGVGYAKAKPSKSDLREAIESLVRGQPIKQTKTKAVGCIIGRLPQPKNEGADVASNLRYDTHIVPLLEKHCVECHQPGEIAPFALTAYEEVIGWGETIREVIEQQRMPPWHADPKVGHFSNARTMSDEEKRTFTDWIAAAMPRGETDREPKVTRNEGGWQLPKTPNATFSMHETGFDVAAEGVIEYQYFVVDPQFKEDRWVAAAQVVPGNRSVVHHAIVFIRPPDGERQSGIGWLTAFVPGQSDTELPDGLARRIPAGSKFVFQMHYTPTGKVEKDNTKIGLVFANEEDVHTEVQTRVVIDRNFEIPPNARDYEVEMQTSRFPKGSQLLGIAPHMHFRGSRFHVTAKYRADNSQPLLHVPNYDFNWQHAYLLNEPLPLDDVTIHCEAVFDNSAQNLVNPNPAATVRWGDQTWEEMALAYLAISIPRESADSFDSSQILSENNGDTKIETAEQREQRAKEVAQAFFDKLDENGDREILRAETPKSFRAFAWKVYDRNKDDKLTWEEVLHHARRSVTP